MYYLIWVVCGVVAAILASEDGEPALNVLLALALGPIGFIIAVVSRNGKIPCEFCRKRIDPKASICPYCQKEQPQPFWKNF